MPGLDGYLSTHGTFHWLPNTCVEPPHPGNNCDENKLSLPNYEEWPTGRSLNFERTSGRLTSLCCCVCGSFES
eukprot:2934692-Amphidinium_carterae.1